MRGTKLLLLCRTTGLISVHNVPLLCAPPKDDGPHGNGCLPDVFARASSVIQWSRSSSKLIHYFVRRDHVDLNRRHQTILISEPKRLENMSVFFGICLLDLFSSNLPTKLDGELGPLVLQTLPWPVHCAWAPAYYKISFSC